MSILLLITEQEVKDLTSVADNVDVSKLRHHIQIAQDTYIKPAIGETCYDALLDATDNDDFTALETTLLDGDNRSFAGLKMALAWWVLYLAYPGLHMTIGNATVQKKTGDNFEPVNLSELSLLRKSSESTAMSYTRYLIAYIQKNSDDYTCYACEGITELTDADDMNASGISFDWDNVITVSESQAIINIGG